MKCLSLKITESVLPNSPYIDVQLYEKHYTIVFLLPEGLDNNTHINVILYCACYFAM